MATALAGQHSDIESRLEELIENGRAKGAAALLGNSQNVRRVGVYDLLTTYTG